MVGKEREEITIYSQNKFLSTIKLENTHTQKAKLKLQKKKEAKSKGKSKLMVIVTAGWNPRKQWGYTTL